MLPQNSGTCGAEDGLHRTTSYRVSIRVSVLDNTGQTMPEQYETKGEINPFISEEPNVAVK